MSSRRPSACGKLGQQEERIRAHVISCWLALLLIRIAETTTGLTWVKTQRDLPAKLKLPPPRKIIEATPARP